MQKKILLVLLLLSFLLVSCTTEYAIQTNSTEKQNKAEKLDSQLDSDDILYHFPPWLDDCDRFRLIFQKELLKYPTLANDFSLNEIYALTYHESLCKTTREFQKISNNPTANGGIMQVDGCWRWGAPYNCTNVQDQIALGISELAQSYQYIINRSIELNLQNTIKKQQRKDLLLISYNRGRYLIKDTLDLLSTEIEHTFYSPYLIQKNNSTLLFVDCTEKDVCINDTTYINITTELQNMNSDFNKALLITCRHNYGYMHNQQGDYCTGDGYGLNYPAAINKITEAINKYQNTGKIQKTAEKEFYIGETEFSNYSWYIKTSINKTGPGPNFFYYDNTSIFIENKTLYLTVNKEKEKWFANEVVLSENLGYGTYAILIENNTPNFDENLVLGFFTYDLTENASKNYFHREIDIEIAKWGDKNNNNTQFALQGTLPLNAIQRFQVNTSSKILLQFNWTKKKNHFIAKDFNQNNTIHEWTYTGDLIPVPGKETIRINFWILNNTEPKNTVNKIAVKSFSFIPNT